MVSHGPTENISVTINATGILDVFFTNTSADMNSYWMTGVIPNGSTVKGCFRGSYGNVCATCPQLGCIWYLCFGNYHGATEVMGTWELGEGTCDSNCWNEDEIPGFEILLVFCALTATFGILWSKKKQYFK
jgi:hypothetical protein